MPRPGRLSREDEHYIRRRTQAGDTPEEIAAALDRLPETVARWIAENPATPASTKQEGGLQPPPKLTSRPLKKTRAWGQLAEEFSKDELDYFEERYEALASQFKDDVLATEQSQMFLLIKLEILLHRNLKAKRSTDSEIERLQGKIDFLYEQIDDPVKMTEVQRSFITETQKIIESMRGANGARSKEFTELEAKHQQLMKDLKGTRDQRLAKIENARGTWLGLIKSLQDEETAAREGRQMALLKMAGEKELKRLGTPKVYLDGKQDHPILSCDTVDLYPEAPEAAEEPPPDASI